MSNLDNARKQHLAFTLNDFAGNKTLDGIELLGKALPCRVTATTGQIVTVAFELQVPFAMPPATMPIATGVYDWLPVQVGDQGLAVAADVYLGGISGLGGGTANLSRRANLTALVYVPISNKSWKPPGGDGNMRIIQGPDGVRLQDSGGHTVVTLDNDGNITLSGTVTITGNLTVKGSTTTVQNLDIQGTESGGGST